MLCTFPGKFGDLLWALPTLRALCKRTGVPVSLLVAAPLASLIPLLRVQPYIGDCWADGNWLTEDTAPITPRVPPTPEPGGTDHLAGYEAVYHLGYTGWPQHVLPLNVQATCNAEALRYGSEGVYITVDDLNLHEPWIMPPPHGMFGGYWDCVYGFTNEHFELKYGLVQLLERRPHWWSGLPPCSIGENTRWEYEAGAMGTTWEEAALILDRTKVFLGCCSALHVLAVAMGVPVVMMEPNPHRHHPIFYPVGQDGHQVTLVKGNDGLPTFDARHVRDVLMSRLTTLIGDSK